MNDGGVVTLARSLDADTANTLTITVLAEVGNQNFMLERISESLKPPSKCVNSSPPPVF